MTVGTKSEHHPAQHFNIFIKSLCTEGAVLCIINFQYCVTNFSEEVVWKLVATELYFVDLKKINHFKRKF